MGGPGVKLHQILIQFVALIAFFLDLPNLNSTSVLVRLYRSYAGQNPMQIMG